MIFKDPSEQNPRLQLPKLSLPVKTNDWQRADCNLSIPINQEFLEVWQNGNSHDLHYAIYILGKTFCNLIDAGKNISAVSTKTGPQDLVTELDTGIEMLFRIWIHRFYSTHKIVGEEGGADQISSQDVVWYIDPVDGTNNYVANKPHVAINIGSIYKGKPFVSFVGLPFQNEYYINTNSIKDSTKIKEAETQNQCQTKIILSSEYVSGRQFEKDLYHSILSDLNIKSHRRRSIGCTLIDVLNGTSTAFYKPFVKPWDIIAPLGLIHYFLPNTYTISLYYKDPNHKNQQIKGSPFANNPSYIEWLNHQFKEKSEIGLIIVTPKDKPELEMRIINAYNKKKET